MKDKDCVRLSVRVQPRASRDEVVGPGADGVLRVRVCAPPVEGAANERLAALIARRLRLPRSNVTVAAGAASRHKVVKVRGAGGEVQEIVKRLMGK
jgi:uncharacterized protein (TIGR00251 family)